MKGRTTYISAVIPFALICFFFVNSALACKAEINEVWDKWEVNFSIETDMVDIVAFAVGNNFAVGGATIDYDNPYAPPEGWNGAFAIKNDGWHVLHSSEAIELPEPFNQDILNGLGDYSCAFLYYYAPQYETQTMAGNNLEGSLRSGYTAGFKGWAQAPDSAFAVIRSNGGVIKGNTSSVPIPGAGWLLFSGLIGIVRYKKRLK